MHTEFLWRNLFESGHLEKEGRIILRWITRKQILRIEVG
jgi:hypothetical protein